jgi:hypothetical protein
MKKLIILIILSLCSFTLFAGEGGHGGGPRITKLERYIQDIIRRSEGGMGGPKIGKALIVDDVLGYNLRPIALDAEKESFDFIGFNTSSRGVEEVKIQDGVNYLIDLGNVDSVGTNNGILNFDKTDFSKESGFTIINSKSGITDIFTKDGELIIFNK